jgi:ABC-type amino acid transport substrate-binding protein
MKRQRIDALRPSLRRCALGLLISGLVISIAFAHFSSLGLAALSEQRWQAVRARGVWRVGIDPGMYPFSFYGPHGWEGFDADLMRALAQRLGLRVDAVPVGYDGLYDAIVAGHTDLAISALVADSARMADFYYSQPYIDVGLRVISPAARPLRGVDDLRGQCVAVALGSEADRAARWLERRIPKLERRVTPNEDEAIAQVRAGRCDAAIVGGRRALSAGCPLLYKSRLSGDLSCFILQSQEYVVAFSRRDVHMAEAFNAALTEMMADGELERIRQRWFGRH